MILMGSITISVIVVGGAHVWGRSVQASLAAEGFRVSEEIRIEGNGGIPHDSPSTDLIIWTLTGISSASGSNPSMDDIERQLSDIHRRYPSTPVIVLLDQDDTELSCRLLEQGVHEVLIRSQMANGSWERVVRHALAREEARKRTCLHRAVPPIRALPGQLERDRLLAAIEQTQDAVIITDPDGTIQYVNPAYEAVTGFQFTEAIGSTPRLHKSGMHEDDFYQEMWTTISGGKTWKGQFINRRKDGTLFTEEATISPVCDVQGNVVNYVAVKRDITEQLNLQARLQQSQKMEAIGQLAGGIAHDFNNLLTVIFGYSETLLPLIPPSDPRRDMVATILDAAERGAGLTRQLLTFSRKQPFSPQIVQLNSLVETIEKLLRRLIGEDVTLTTSLNPEIHPIRVDPGQLEQVMINVAVNARDAMPSGGELTIETRNVCVTPQWAERVMDARPGDYVVLKMADTGTGMTPEVQDRIFEPFFTTKGEGKGTGLGLATVFGIVRQSEGFIEVFSELERGTCFEMYFPAATEPALKDSAPCRPQASEGKETILLVEDEEGVRRIAKLVLEGAGYRVLEASDGTEAVEILEDHANDVALILTDVVMPEMGGQALVQELRKRGNLTKVLLMSGYTSDIMSRQGLQEYGTGVLEKPFTPLSLKQKVREALDAGPR
jgi:two-component system, cell cycle sensor histidine kinase and response regulator CckA